MTLPFADSPLYFRASSVVGSSPASRANGNAFLPLAADLTVPLHRVLVARLIDAQAQLFSHLLREIDWETVGRLQVGRVGPGDQAARRLRLFGNGLKLA